jgi:predicted cupin superfamily sugar epimerase
MRLLITFSLALSAGTIAASPTKHPSAQDVITTLNLAPNPEKGYFRQTFADSANANNRSYSTAIYYLLEGSVGASYWHRVDAVEIWHYYAGAPLLLRTSWNNGTATRKRILGSDIFRDQEPQIVIQKWEWQSARSLGDWTLVGTTVAPGFVESGYEIEAEGWEPVGTALSEGKNTGGRWG